MRIALLSLVLALTAPALAQEAVKVPEKLSRTDFQQVVADTGPAYVGGQPSEAALRDMAAKGVKTVVSLRTQREMDNRSQVPFDEAALVKELGMTYVHIPLGGPDAPYTPAAVETFSKAMSEAGGKVLLHCTVGWRASHMWAAYLVKVKGLSVEEAKRQAAVINLNGYPQGGAPMDSLLGLTKAP